MSSVIEDRLRELGCEVPEVAAAVAAYVPALRDGNYVYTAGQLPFVSGALPETGKVGVGEGLVTPERAEELAQLCALNALAAVRGVIGDLDRIVQVVKVTAFVASDPSFTGQPAVANGASMFLGRVFGDLGIHVRSAVGVAVLPLDAPVEIEFVFKIAD
ncbi:RidA family protein [Leucobacter luti]|uniref:Enamine deaminase RidA (YjgF/YER057c/UK114 family) n=1 Tax=Leucobacter luti TaxID=340320 RepID=A0A4R6RVC9_9MICO|nr:RidA family protein [Leucobacter luti]MCW2289731.1 enamine deaminase RidA (YjgF/YER057c/UK114 family) [Leucobacter luti]QYM77107.1 RidA family protein [Leucobacter luti]TCK34267.1 enamine deaminase RidA (YjgF/YER057c/UK114 family) [Leucobacter luti]TDP90893.1 enamine deaminase RidA (YjgF/YER057c/UK114 family) [Leucobacter luti]